MDSWLEYFNSELDSAKKARLNGNEGRARVCARRAAGAAAGEYLKRLGIQIQNQNAYHNIKLLEDNSGISFEMREILNHFVIRVDINYQLPNTVDLIRDALWLRDNLLRGSDGSEPG